VEPLRNHPFATAGNGFVVLSPRIHLCPDAGMTLADRLCTSHVTRQLHG
jgi:hypothetical protein